jgi:hypothetical protein
MVISFPKEEDRKNRLTIRERNVIAIPIPIDKSQSFTLSHFVSTALLPT